MARASRHDRETSQSRSAAHERRAPETSTEEDSRSRTAATRERASTEDEAPSETGGAKASSSGPASRRGAATASAPSGAPAATGAPALEGTRGSTSPAAEEEAESGPQAGPTGKARATPLATLLPGLGLLLSLQAAAPTGAAGTANEALASDLGADPSVEGVSKDVEGQLSGTRAPLAGKKSDGFLAPALASTAAGGEKHAGPRPTALAQPTESTETPLRTPHLERAERLLEQVRLRIRPELREALLELRPRELGRIAIQLSVREGRVRASLRAERAEALSVLENHLPELRAMFESAGLEPHTLELGLGLAPHGDRAGRDAKQGDDAGRMDHGARATARAGNELSSGALACALAERMGIDLYA